MNICKMRKTIELERIKYSIIGTSLFYLAANGFILFNYVPQHDALNYVNEFAGSWEILLGRFMLPVYGKLRGEITMPWLIGLISMVCLTAVTYMLTDLLEIRKPFLIMISAAFLSANITQTELLSSFTYVADAYILSVLLACLFVYILNKTHSRKWKIVSFFMMVLSLGIYQAHISFAATLIILLSIKGILKRGTFGREDFDKLLKHFFWLILSCLFYYLINKASIKFSGLHEVSDYHSVLGFLNDLGALPSRLFVAFGSKFSMFFIRKEMSLGRIGNCFLAVSAFLLVIYLFRIRKVDLRSRILLLMFFLISLLTALMINIGAGMIAYRLSFSVFVYYLLLISFVELFLSSSVSLKKNIFFSGICCLLFMVIWSNIVYSNGAYTIQKVIFDRSISLYTRVLDDIYEIPEYEHNHTQVVILGDWNFDNYSHDFAKKEFRDLGTFMNTSTTYRQTVGSLMRYLGEDMQLVGDETIISAMASDSEVQAMPSFPTKGYCRMIGDYLVINF